MFTPCRPQNVPARRAQLREPWVLAVLLIGASGWPGFAQTTQPSAVARTVPPQEPPTYTSASRVPDTLLGRPSRPVLILPSEPGETGRDRMQRSEGTIAKLPAEPHRLPEGYIVAAREARAERTADQYLLHLAKAQGLPDAPPLRVLPNRCLAMLETVLAADDGPRTFLVTGRVTEFQGANFILLQNLVEVLPKTPQQPPAETFDSKPAQDEPPAAGGASATRPANLREPTAEEVMQQLMERDTLRAVALPDLLPRTDSASPPPGAEEPPSSQQQGKEAPAWAEGTLLVDRIGRVMPGESWWMLVFEDRGQQPKHKPIPLLPNRLLETAVALSQGGTQGVVFVVSGDVTLHKGTNYLLLHKVLVRHDLGNLR